MVKSVPLDPRMVYWAQAAAAASDVEDFILRTRQGEREQITRRAVVEDVTLTQVKIQGAWYAKHILNGVETLAIGDSYAPMETTQSTYRVVADYEISSDLFIESGANITDRQKIGRYVRAMGVGDLFPPIYARLRLIGRDDLLRKDVPSSRPLRAEDVGRVVPVIENGHHRAYGCSRLGHSLKVVDGDLAEMSNVELTSVYSAAHAYVAETHDMNMRCQQRGC